MLSNQKRMLFQNVTKRRNVYHDDEKCYCHDTIEHLKMNEQRFTYPAVRMVYNPDGDNEEYSKRCTLNEFRQRTVEWMISIQDYFTNCEETLEMAVCLFDFAFYNDSFLNLTESDNKDQVFSYETKNKHYCNQERLHLTALTCYFLSCKFWERFPPKASKLIHLTEYSYTENQLLCMERELLMNLEFDLKIPLISQYIEFYMLHEDEFLLSRITTMSHYLTNLALVNLVFTNRPSSSLAAVILQLSKMILYVFSASNENGNGPIYQKQATQYDEHLFECEDFVEILKDIWQIFIKSVTGNSYKLQKKKFSEQKYSYLCLYLEAIDLKVLKLYYQELTCWVKVIISRKDH
jgi:hypothetical protein